MEINNSSFLSIEQVQDQIKAGQSTNVNNLKLNTGVSFDSILKEKLTANTNEVKFSKHAFQRLKDRNIDLSGDQLNRLSVGAQKAESKGIKDSLVLVDDLAFIVNVPSKTVVTAMDSTETKENVFTNITGAVIV